MAAPSPSAPAADARRESPRVALARAASAAALGQESVTGLDGGSPSRLTLAGTERLPGVTVFASGEQYDVALFLTAAPTDLHALAARVQRAVRSAAGADGLSERLGDVHVTFTDLTLPDETTRP